MDVLVALAMLAEELCDPRPHREPIQEWTASRNRRVTGAHVTMRPGLLAELHEAIRPLLGGLDEGARGVPRSTPPLQLDALDRYIDIEVKAACWAETVGLAVRDTPQGNIRGLVGAASRLGDRAALLLVDVRRWRNTAAVITGWHTTFAPEALCPLADCGQRGTLRINITEKTAVCIACGAWWGPTAIGVLAEHIRRDEPAGTRIRVRSGAVGHGGWSTRLSSS